MMAVIEFIAYAMVIIWYLMKLKDKERYAFVFVQMALMTLALMMSAVIFSNRTNKFDPAANVG